MANAIKKTAVFILMTTFFSICGHNARGENSVVFAVWSDSHFGAYDFTDATRLAIIEQINNIGSGQIPEGLETALKDKTVDFLLHCGDITERGDNASWNDPNLADHRSYLATLKHLNPQIKHYAVLGNHDSRKQENVRDEFKTLYGNTYYSFDAGGVRFIALDPYPENNTAAPKLDNKQLIWLSDNLKELPAETPVIIVMHVLPVCDQAIDRSSRLDEQSSEQLWRILENKNVAAFFHGHWHKRSVKNFNGIPLIAPAGFAYYRDGCKKGDPIIGVVNITSDQMSVYSYNWHTKSFEGLQFTSGLRASK